MKFKEFLKECQEKDVFKNLSIYLVSSWLLLQVFSVTWEPMGLPKITLTYLLLVLLVGFPVYIYLLWRLRIKKLRITAGDDPRTIVKGDDALTDSGIDTSDTIYSEQLESPYRSAFRRMYFSFLLIIGAICVFSATLIIKTNFFSSEDKTTLSTVLQADSSNKIAVLTFDNNTADPALDVVGKMAVDWIMHGITQNKVGQVISPKIVDDYSNVLKASILPSGGDNILKSYLKPAKIITGTYYLRDGNLLIQCSVLDENMIKTLISFEAVSCSPESPLECIEALKQKILGYLVTQEDGLASFEETPPNFEAYQFLLEAHSKYNNTDPEHLKLLNKAIESDNNFFTPKIDRLEYYYNRDQFAVVDSLYKLLSKETSNNKRQMNLLNLYESLLKGDNRNAYKYFLNEYNHETFDLENNSTAMVLALQYVNKPQDLEAIYTVLSMDDMDLEKCLFCEFRTYTMALALIDLGKPQEAVDLLAPYKNLSGHRLANEALLMAYVKLEDAIAASRLMNNAKLTSDTGLWHKLSLFGGKEFLREGNPEIANLYFDGLISDLEEEPSKMTNRSKTYVGQAYYFKGDYKKAQPYLKAVYDKTNSIEILPLLAVSQYKNDKTNEALALIAQLNAMRAPFQFGEIDYRMAQYYAATGDKSKAMDHLLKAVAAGYRYTPSAYQYDLHFKEFVNTEAFNEIMNFWN
jgi:hypothetical protein